MFLAYRFPSSTVLHETCAWHPVNRSGFVERKREFHQQISLSSSRKGMIFLLECYSLLRACSFFLVPFFSDWTVTLQQVRRTCLASQKPASRGKGLGDFIGSGTSSLSLSSPFSNFNQPKLATKESTKVTLHPLHLNPCAPAQYHRNWKSLAELFQDKYHHWKSPQCSIRTWWTNSIFLSTTLPSFSTSPERTDVYPDARLSSRAFLQKPLQNTWR